MSEFIERWNALPVDERAEVLASYDASERARVHAEWVADGSPEHECGWDTYCGGCITCGALLDA